MEAPWQALIVDNDHDCAKVVGRALSAFLAPHERPVRTILATCPEFALVLVATLPPTRLLVVTEYDLQGALTGADVLAAVHRERRDACCVLFSRDAHLGARAGFDAGFEKPMRMRDLVRRLHGLLPRPSRDRASPPPTPPGRARAHAGTEW